MARRIKLTRSAVSNINNFYYGAWRMRIDASDAEGEGLDPYVFIYQRGLVNPHTGEPCDNFCAVVGPAQLSQIPIGAPDEANNYPFFRLDYVELDFQAQAVADETWTLIKKEVGILVEGMGKLSQLSVVEEVWFPDEPANSESI